MRRTFLAVAGGVFVVGAIVAQSAGWLQLGGLKAAAAQPAPCAFPAQMGSMTPAEAAWRIFVALQCPVTSNQYPYVTWETWIDQTAMYPQHPDPNNPPAWPSAPAAPRRFHRSVLDVRRAQSQPMVQNCTVSQLSGRTICEEVRLNRAAYDYIVQNKMWYRQGQAALAQQGATIHFPPPAIEVKGDWIKLETWEPTPQGVHVETVDGVRYALAGLHMSSKLLDNWLWATWEPQHSATNPFRCRALGCNDPFGSVPATSGGQPTQLTQAVQGLMTAAKLAPEWQHYRLDGVQTVFTANGSPTQLGNSVIEAENAGVPLHQASCITCHDVSSIKGDGTDGSTLLTGNPVGNPAPLPDKSWIRRDFVWSLLLANP